MPKPLRVPFTEILPTGPASNVNGGNPDSGPVMAGVGSAVAGGGSAGAAGAADCDTAACGAAAVSVDFATVTGCCGSLPPVVASPELCCLATLLAEEAGPVLAPSCARAIATDKILAIAMIAPY